MNSFRMESRIPVPAPTAFAWHERDGAFDRLGPPWEPARLLRREGSIRDGDRTVIGLKIGPFLRKWVAVHEGFVQDEAFEDRQASGPFAYWHHRHRFLPVETNPEAFRMIDEIDFRLPLSPLSDWVAGGFARRKLEAMFRYRHATLADDLLRHETYRDRPRMTVAVSGAGGTIGTVLCAILETGGHRVVRLVRREAERNDELRWDPERGIAEPDRLLGVDAVVHLAAAGIADRRWNEKRMQEIRDSRVLGTRALIRSLPKGEGAPRVFVGASAAGYAQDGFLAEVADAWDREIERADASGMRAVKARIGYVLTPKAGFLPPFLRQFSWGFGGTLGAGTQAVNWISIDDTAWAIHEVLMDDRYRGAVTLTAPQPVSQREWAAALGEVLKRPVWTRAPGWAVRILAGRMAGETVLSGTSERPEMLLKNGYRFRDPALVPALRRLTGRQE